MRMSIVGLGFSGKSTFFELLTTRGMQGAASGKKGATIGTAFVPDERLDKLSDCYQPKKTTPANLEFIDTSSLSLEGKGNSFTGGTLEEVKRADGLALMIQEFASPMAPHPSGSVDGFRDLEFILSEFILADYVTLEKRAERLRKQVQVNKKTEDQRELEAIDKVLAALENEQPASTLDLTENELKALSPYQLLTLKPLLAVLNIGEDQIADMDARIAAYQERFTGCTVTALCASFELELTQMEEGEAAEFMDDAGITTTAFERVVASCFETNGLKVFFTVGHDECRAWPVSRDATAFDCAGAIHSDLQRGFIRAVVMPYAEFEANPTPDAFKQNGSQQKKDYAVDDGDIIEIRFSV